MALLSSEPASTSATDPRPQTADHPFVFARVDRTEAIHDSYRLRYQVFCLERGFLPPEDYPNREESDCYDPYALHFLASHPDGQPVGTARLVRSGPLGLPMMPHCKLGPGYRFLVDPDHAQRHRYAEISRTAVSQRFRRHQGNRVHAGPCRDKPPAVLPSIDARGILLGFFRLGYQESKRRGITHWLAAMECSVYVMLKRMGFAFTPIGPEVDYHGPVRPYLAEIAVIERYLYLRRPQTFEYLIAGLDRHLVPSFGSDS